MRTMALRVARLVASRLVLETTQALRTHAREFLAVFYVAFMAVCSGRAFFCFVECVSVCLSGGLLESNDTDCLSCLPG